MPCDAQRHGPHRIVGPGFHERVWALVRTVPPGLVTTYGDLAAALGSKNVARHVGYAMAALPVAARLSCGPACAAVRVQAMGCPIEARIAPTSSRTP